MRLAVLARPRRVGLRVPGCGPGRQPGRFRGTPADPARRSWGIPWRSDGTTPGGLVNVLAQPSASVRDAGEPHHEGRPATRLLVRNLEQPTADLIMPGLTWCVPEPT